MKIYVAVNSTYDEDFIGVDGRVFTLILNEELAPGTTITTNLNGGLLIYISGDHSVSQIGENFLHWATLISESPDFHYPGYLLEEGTEYSIATAENYKNGTFISNPKADERYRKKQQARRNFPVRRNSSQHHQSRSSSGSSDDDILIAGALYIAASAMNDESSSSNDD